MSMISRQCDELREVSDILRTDKDVKLARIVDGAIDTIQALSAKVADQNLNRSEIPNSSTHDKRTETHGVCSDNISRQEALALVDRPIVPTGDATYDNAREDERASIKDDLLSLPSAQQWIPCSERLPEENVVVLTQAKFKDDIKMAVSARQDYNYWTGWGTREVNIVAWMPLPEPYKAESEDKE